MTEGEAMIALIDYGAGNVRSVRQALTTVGAEVRLVRDPGPILDAEKVVLPGVGAFGDCMASLHHAGLVDALRQVVEQGKPLLGICVGMQVLFEEGEEMGHHVGLGLLPGRVIRFSFSSADPSPALPHGGREGNVEMSGVGHSPSLIGEGPGEGSPLKIPHTGWNQVEPVRGSPLLRGLLPGAWAYFNHAYFCRARPEHILAVTDYGGPFPSIVSRGPIYGVQFHPEKSQEVGLHILRNFVEHIG
jgi:glutamine amidotransferase